MSVRQLARFQFLNESSGVGCILYQFVHLLLHDLTCSAGLNLHPTCQQSSGFESVFSEGRERLSLSVMCSQPAPLLDVAAGLSLYLACSLNNEHRLECIDCGYYHYLGPLTTTTNFCTLGPSREVVMLLNFLYSMTAWVLLNQSKLMDVPFTTNS